MRDLDYICWTAQCALNGDEEGTDEIESIENIVHEVFELMYGVCSVIVQ